MAIILDGKKIAKKIKEQLKKQVGDLRKKPGLAVILIGQNPSSQIYVKLKEKAAKKISIKFQKFLLPARTSKNKIIKLIERLNKDKKIHGIIVQLPLPKHLNPDKIIQKIDPGKDVDGFVVGSKFISPIHQAILELLKVTKKSLKNKGAVILTKNLIFAKPLKTLLERKKIKTKIIHFTKSHLYVRLNVKMRLLMKRADVIIIALGQPYFLKSKMIKKNSIIIDVGYSRVSAKGRSASGGKNKPVGDVDPKCYQRASFVSPVPGGVGPLTVVFLLKNAVKAAKK